MRHGAPAAILQSVKLIAVSKTVPEHAIEEAIGLGQRRFGENRVQEAKAKWPALKERHPDLELHLIGPLQSNKVRDAVELFDVIHSVDRPKIAARARRGNEARRKAPAPAGAGEYRRRAAEGRRPSRRDGRLCGAMPVTNTASRSKA